MKRMQSWIQFFTFFAAIYATLNFVNERLVITAIIFWLTYALLCLGLVTAKEVKEIRSK